MCPNLTIPGPAGNIEAQIFDPSSTSTPNPMGIVLCHPHPGYGGTMSFPLIRELFHHMEEYTTIRFNFRGVGRSEGVSGDGTGEIEDLRSVCELMLHTYPAIKKILLIGYSFGAAISVAMVNQHPAICGIVAISPPFKMLGEFFQDTAVTKPKFFIIGSQDDFTPENTFKNAVAEFSPPKTSLIVPGENHFWSGREAYLCEKILEWVQLTFPNP
ncbi:MAG: alpha/beta hydrolase [Promethearchaeota archaeon]